MKCLLAILLAAIPCLAFPATADELNVVLSSQAAAWNRGDIEGFMEFYMKSDDLRFASGGGISRGWKTTLERYRRNYPDRSAMGTLEFSELEITELAPDVALAFGRWRLIRETDAPHGLFTLTFRRHDGKWVIVQDHTSSAG